MKILIGKEYFYVKSNENKGDIKGREGDEIEREKWYTGKQKNKLLLLWLEGGKGMNVIVNLKSIGKKRNSVKEEIFFLENRPKTVRQLIEETVKTCVKDYKERREGQELLKGLTKEEIEDQAAAGKVSFGVNYGERDADLEEALSNALQSYEDGIYRIFIEDEEAGALDAPAFITEETKLTFVRLTMLAGRMW